MILERQKAKHNGEYRGSSANHDLKYVFFIENKQKLQASHGHGQTEKKKTPHLKPCIQDYEQNCRNVAQKKTKKTHERCYIVKGLAGPMQCVLVRKSMQNI